MLLPPVGDGNDADACNPPPPPPLPGGAVAETCGLNPRKNPDWYGCGGKGACGACTREWSAREESVGSDSDRGGNPPGMGDATALWRSSTLTRFRGFGDCAVYDGDELATRLLEAWG
jgi:hypothetical protein